MPAVNLITTLPHFISKEEHTALVASTPTSFNDIPPVIRHREENVSITLDPAFGNFTNQTPTQGTLYVLTSVLVFMSTAGAGFQIEYPKITLHAISRGEGGPSIYCQLDDSVGTEADANDSEGVTDMSELSIVPQNTESLNSIFEALSECAALHPDPREDEDDIDDDAFVDLNGSPFETFNGDENQELSEVGRAALAHLESIIDDPHHLQPTLHDSDEDEDEDEGNAADGTKAAPQ